MKVIGLEVGFIGYRRYSFASSSPVIVWSNSLVRRCSSRILSILEYRVLTGLDR